MNYCLSLNRCLNSLNKRFLINKFENNLKYNLISNHLVLRNLSNHSGKLFGDSKELEESLRKAKESGNQTSDLIKRLFFNYSKQFDYENPENKRNESIVDRIKQLSQELSQNESNDAINAALLEFFVKCGDLKSALDSKNRISKDFRLDSFKLFDLSTLLVNNDKTNAAINLIENEINKQKISDRNFRDKRQDFIQMRDKSINRLLNALIDKQIETEDIKKVFKMCIRLSPTKVNKTVAGPLIKMHLVRKDLTSALKEFVEIGRDYGVIPWSIEMMRVFIDNNNQKNLETVVKTSTQVYGPYSTALDLSAAYLYNNMEEEAQKQISKISRLSQKSIELVCSKFIRDQRFDCLKSFVLMTQSIDGIDKLNMFSHLIIAYQKSGQKDKALDVLNLMKEQNIEPTEELLRLYDRK